MIEQTAKDYARELEKLGISFKIEEHPEVTDVGECLGYFGLTLDQGASSMLLKADGQFVLVNRRDDTKLDFGKIKKLLQAQSVQVATKEEFVQLTNLRVGAARPYIPGIKTLTDKQILEKDIIQSGSGSFTCSIRYKTSDLHKIPNSIIVDVATTTRLYQGPQRVFSGTRATGKLHLGNYLGAVKGYIELQNNPDLECIYMVMDLHTITTPYNSQTLSQSTRDIIIDYLAAGLDPQKAIISAQSLVPEHTYLSFIFSSVMSIARMQHLPTYKDKVKQYPNQNTMALLNYPVLMAADILIYKASLVPVGIDQEPHLEIAREVARKMNELYGTDFPEPKRFATAGEYIPNLQGEGKMSKSIEGSYINLTDDLETIKKRLAGAPTDSGKGNEIPTTGGVANLLKFVELFQGKETRQEYEAMYLSSGIRYGDLKSSLAEAIFSDLQPIQEKHRELSSNLKMVDEIIHEGANKAKIIASETLEETKSKMGFIG